MNDDFEDLTREAEMRLKNKKMMVTTLQSENKLSTLGILMPENLTEDGIFLCEYCPEV
jgi:hypothetical protein